jgi:protocatechuate 3,4-dioxygenase beta subunit
MTRLLAAVLMTIASAQPACAQPAPQSPAEPPSHAVIADSAEPGLRLTVAGRVVDEDGSPVPGASLYVYQTDASGEYVRGASGGGSGRPRLFAHLRSDQHGRYSFSTIKPGSYPNTRNPAHIHFEVTAAGHERRVYEIVFEGDPDIPAQFRRQAQQPFGGVAIVSVRGLAGEALAVEHDVRLRKS